MANKKFEQLVLETIVNVGGVVDRIRRDRHLVVYWTVNGHKLVVTTSRTPSDPRAVRNIIGTIRSMARRVAGTQETVDAA